MGAAGSWIVGLENVSSIQPWLSDCLCRASTGDASPHSAKERRVEGKGCHGYARREHEHDRVFVPLSLLRVLRSVQEAPAAAPSHDSSPVGIVLSRTSQLECVGERGSDRRAVGGPAQLREKGQASRRGWSRSLRPLRSAVLMRSHHPVAAQPHESRGRTPQHSCPRREPLVGEARPPPALFGRGPR